MIPRLYFDTSVFGGVFDEEFEEISTLIFEKVKLGQIICVYSNLSEIELQSAPVKVRNYFAELPKEFLEYVEVTEDAYELAQKYLDEKVVGPTSADDCRHIATATLNKVDFLVSWNFKHIVNVFRIRGYNSINLRCGYSQLDIRSPKEIVYNEDEK
ncbi:PIN domain-containing protein [Pedobacter jejuensis]|uniref:PIN domain protein n=1 Tax=Pedobacter jejuensis TaxID=1268550 RepID=A0A3N0C016_9SPHI|nr:PIN domain protein [Pedobacter jejuensis]RNL55531.1 PIN domain protein [Pedobacter jejuensis]